MGAYNCIMANEKQAQSMKNLKDYSFLFFFPLVTWNVDMRTGPWVTVLDHKSDHWRFCAPKVLTLMTPLLHLFMNCLLLNSFWEKWTLSLRTIIFTAIVIASSTCSYVQFYLTMVFQLHSSAICSMLPFYL